MLLHKIYALPLIATKQLAFQSGRLVPMNEIARAIGVHGVGLSPQDSFGVRVNLGLAGKIEREASR